MLYNSLALSWFSAKIPAQTGPHRLAARTLPSQGRDHGFESHWGHQTVHYLRQTLGCIKITGEVQSQGMLKIFKIFIPLTLFTLFLLVVYILYPFPLGFWLFIHSNDIKNIQTITKDPTTKVLSKSFRSHDISPSTISVVWVGTSTLDQKEIEQRITGITHKELNEKQNNESLEGVLSFNTVCKWSVNGVSDITRNPEYDLRLSHLYYYVNSQGKYVTVRVMPLDGYEVYCNNTRLTGKLIEIAIEVARKYP